VRHAHYQLRLCGSPRQRSLKMVLGTSNPKFNSEKVPLFEAKFPRWQHDSTCFCKNQLFTQVQTDPTNADWTNSNLLAKSFPYQRASKKSMNDVHILQMDLWGGLFQVPLMVVQRYFREEKGGAVLWYNNNIF
jgi:hypothetical protein